MGKCWETKFLDNFGLFATTFLHQRLSSHNSASVLQHHPSGGEYDVLCSFFFAIFVVLVLVIVIAFVFVFVFVYLSPRFSTTLAGRLQTEYPILLSLIKFAPILSSGHCASLL